jgi:phosphoglycolate phosphatase
LKEGSDVAVLSIGTTGNFAAAAIQKVEQEHNITVAHYDMRFAKPLDEALLDEVLEVYEKNYGQTYLQTNVTYEGLDALVRELHDECGMRIGVLSNKEHPFVCNLVEQVLDAGVCEAVQGNIPDKPSKPDPYLSRRVAEALGVATEECVMVGDSDVDIRTAKNAGMLPVSVSWGYRDADFLRERGAEYVVSTPQELRALLLRLIEQN